MRPFGMLALILVVAALTACQAPQQDVQETPAEDSGVQDEVTDIEQEVDELDNLTEEIDMSDLEGLEEDLDQI